MKKVKEIIKASMKNWQGCEPCIYMPEIWMPGLWYIRKFW